jgi:hypothetical protein
MANKPRFPRRHFASRVAHAQTPRKLILRFLALISIGLVLTIVAPVIADQNTPSPDLTSPTPVATPAPSPSPSESQTVTADDSIIPSATSSPAPSATASPSNSAGAGKSESATASASPTPAPAANQSMKINLPTVLPVDPRAMFRSLPSVNISGPQYLLACITAGSVSFDIYVKNAGNALFNGQRLANGDLTSDLLISGTTEQVVAVLNSYGGMRLTGTKGPLGGLYLNLRLIALSAPSLDPVHCSQGSSANTTTIYLRSLALGQNLIKKEITLKG